MGELHIYIYDQIGSDFFSEGTTAKGISEKLEANKEASEIILHINSPGGSVFEGYTIYNLLKASGKKVKSRVEGMCASIATLIALSADSVEMLPLAQWLVHNPFTFMEGDSEDLKKAADQLEQIQNQLLDVYITKTKKSKDDIQNLMNEDKFLTAQEAVDWGFADDVVEPMKAVAYWKKAKREDKMDNKVLEAINKLSDRVGKLFKNEVPVNVAAKLKDGTEINVEPGLSEGATASLNGAPMAEGEHTLEDGTVISVGADGKINSLKAPVDSTEAENLKKENEELKAKVEEAEAKAAEQAKALEEQNKNIQEITTEIQNLKKLTVGGGKAPDKPIQNFKEKQTEEKKTAWDEMADKLKNNK
jgi:ATP-dependent Clp endopeptidase proteolytic subunit ClpP